MVAKIFYMTLDKSLSGTQSGPLMLRKFEFLGRSFRRWRDRWNCLRFECSKEGRV